MEIKGVQVARVREMRKLENGKIRCEPHGQYEPHGQEKN